MEIKKNSEQDIVIFGLTGRVDSDGAVQLEQALHEVIGEEQYKIIIDLSKVTYINSAGLRVLADVRTATQENDGDLRLAGVTTKVRRVFEIIGFHKFFNDYNTVLEAMQGF